MNYYNLKKLEHGIRIDEDEISDLWEFFYFYVHPFQLD